MVLVHWFLPYLWGMETLLTSFSAMRWFISFLPYLWGMETIFVQLSQTFSFPRSYRTYEEWKHLKKQIDNLSLQSSYRTYEEWKPVSIHTTGNSLFGFLPYLWGMETPCNNLWRWYRFWVLTVPMRNGNKHRILGYVPGNHEFLPYLWGMETTLRVLPEYFRSWFLPYLWGMETCSQLLSYHLGLLVLTVPMRNGNNIRKTLKKWEKLRVLTVPMRNGNQDTQMLEKSKTRFLPYLWGMETRLPW